MANVDKLNKAIKTLKDECKKNHLCETCPLYDNYVDCSVRQLPFMWKTIKESDSNRQDGEQDAKQ